MGLDMYLNRTREHYDGTKQTMQIGYWRKDNQIFNWFIENVDEKALQCERVKVTLEQLQKLRETCQKVLTDIKLAPELLPPRRGSFFGHYDYDDFYLQGLKDTIIIIDYLQLMDWKGDEYIFEASW